MHAYLDDGLIRADTAEQCRAHRDLALDLLTKLGWTINWAKSELTHSVPISILLRTPIDTVPKLVP